MTTARSSRRSSRAVLALLAVIPVAGGARVSAHRLDEFLQAARIAIEPDRVELEMSLTPGTAVAEGLIREIDADADGVFSELEKRAYVDRALHSMVLRVDEGPRLTMTMAASDISGALSMRTGDGVIAIRAKGRLPSLPAGSHRLWFRNEHAPVGSVYLANALVPESDRVAVTGQERDSDQRALTIQFTTSATQAAANAWRWVGVAATLLIVALLIRRFVAADDLALRARSA